MIAGYHTYATAQSSASHEGSSPAICTRSMSMELVKHIDPIGSILGIVGSPVNCQESASDLNAEPNTSAIHKAELFLPRGHTFCRIDSMTEEHELIEDIVPMRTSTRLHVELVSWYGRLWEYRVASLPESTGIRERYHKAELGQKSGSDDNPPLPI